MIAPVDGWLERDGVRLHYLEWTPDSEAERQPACLLLHGLSSNARYWERLAQHLPGRRLVALDQRGHGLTGQPPEEAIKLGWAHGASPPLLDIPGAPPSPSSW